MGILNKLHKKLTKLALFEDVANNFYKNLSVLSSSFCMTWELKTLQTVCHQDIMVTQYNPGIMRSNFTWHNL